MDSGFAISPEMIGNTKSDERGHSLVQVTRVQKWPSWIFFDVLTSKIKINSGDGANFD